MYYPGIDFQTSISIGTIYSIHYYEYRTDFYFFMRNIMIFGSLFMQTKERLLLQVIKLNFG